MMSVPVVMVSPVVGEGGVFIFFRLHPVRTRRERREKSQSGFFMEVVVRE